MQHGSFRFPDNCQDADCDFLVTYQASGDNSVVFELRGRGNWQEWDLAMITKW